MKSSEGSLPFPPAGPAKGEELELGSISGVFGVSGEVRLHLHNRDSEALRTPRAVVLVDPAGCRWRAQISSRSGAGRRVLGRIKGLSDRDLAASLKGWKIMIEARELPPLGPGEYWVWQVEGLEAYTGPDDPMGRVLRVHETAAGDVFEVRVGEETVFVPSSKEFVLKVDVPGGRVHFAPGSLQEDP